MIGHEIGLFYATTRTCARRRQNVCGSVHLQTKYGNLRDRSRIATELKEAVTRGDWVRIGCVTGGETLRSSFGRAANE